MFKLYMRNGSFEDELFVREADIKCFFGESTPAGRKYWLVIDGEEPIRITEASYAGLKEHYGM